MFEDNWMMYILILLMLFSSNGGISHTETAVLIGTVMALVLSQSGGLGGLFGGSNSDGGCGCSNPNDTF